MPSLLDIEPVGRLNRMKAFRFLVGGVRCSPAQEARAKIMHQLATRHGESKYRLWWARQDGTCLASAVVIESHGKTGLLFHTDLNAAGADARALGELIRKISLSAIDDGMGLVQTMLEPGAGDNAQLLTSAGLIKLAELIYLNLDLTTIRPLDLDANWTWRNGEQFSQAELIEVLDSSYCDSQDCPGLTGVRRMEDVVAGYKATGAYEARAWWIVERHGEAAGCVLVSDWPEAHTAEIVYAGTAPACRRRGLGRAMLRRAAAEARQRGCESIRLAVDAANAPARALYDSEGYHQTGQRMVYVMRPEDVANAVKMSNL